MRGLGQKAALGAGAVLLLSAALSGAVLLVLPRPYTRFEYLIAGTAAAAVWLAAAFAYVGWKTSTLRIVRRGERG